MELLLLLYIITAYLRRVVLTHVCPQLSVYDHHAREILVGRDRRPLSDGGGNRSARRKLPCQRCESRKDNRLVTERHRDFAYMCVHSIALLYVGDRTTHTCPPLVLVKNTDLKPKYLADRLVWIFLHELMKEIKM
jgi:hypothetical protein